MQVLFEKCLQDEICMSPAKLYMGVKMQVNSGTLFVFAICNRKKLFIGHLFHQQAVQKKEVGVRRKDKNQDVFVHEENVHVNEIICKSRYR